MGDKKAAAKKKNIKGEKDNKNEAREEEKAKAIQEIVPYKKSLTTGKRLYENDSKESREMIESRAKLLQLLKDKIDKKQMTSQRIRFTRSELKLLRDMEEFKKKVDQEEKDLAASELALEAKNSELKKIIDETNEERLSITKLLNEKKLEDEAKLNKLSKMLDNVKADQLAVFLESMNQDLFLAIVAKMKPKTFAKALKFMSKENAIKLNEKFLATQKD